MKSINGKNTNSLHQAVQEDLTNAAGQIEPGEVTYSDYHERYNNSINNYTVLDADNEEKNTIIEAYEEAGADGLVPDDDREARAKLRAEFSKKYYAVSLRRAFCGAAAADAKDALGDNGHNFRTFSKLLDTDMTGKAFIKNKRFKEVMMTGTQTQQKEEVSRRLEEIGNFDLSFVNFNDDADFVKNYDKYAKLSDYADFQNNVKWAESLGIDLTLPRFANFVKKSQLINDLAMVVSYKEKLLSGPVYDVADLEKLTAEERNEFKNIKTIGPAVKTAVDGAGQLEFFKKNMKSVAPFFDPKLTIEQKIAKGTEEANKESPDYKKLTEKKNEPAAEAQPVGNDGFHLNEDNNISFDAGDEPEPENGQPAAAAQRGDALAVPVIVDTPDGFFAKQSEMYGENIATFMDSKPAEAQKWMIKAVVLNRMQRRYSEYVHLNPEAGPDELRRRFNEETLKYEETLLNYTPGLYEATAGMMDREAMEQIILGNADAVNSIDRKVADAEKSIREDERKKAEDPDAYLLSRQEQYRKQIKENRTVIKQVLGEEFELSDEEIEKMVSKERIERHDRAAKLLQEIKKVNDYSAVAAGAPFSDCVNRIVAYMGKTPDDTTDEYRAAEYNNAFFSELAGITDDSNEFRRKTFADALNNVNKITKKDIIPTVDLARNEGESEKAYQERIAEAEEKARFENAFRNYRSGAIAWDLEATFKNIGTAGLAFTETAKEKYDKQRDYLTGLGVNIKKTVLEYGDDFYFTLPLNKLSAEKCSRLMQHFDQNKMAEILGILGRVEVSKKNMEKTEELSGQTYSREDFVFTSRMPEDERGVSTSADLRRVYQKYAKELKDADHFYNFNNSAQYKNLLTALEKADELLGGIKGAVPDEKKQSLRDVIRDVNTAANAYKEAKKNQPANENRAKRLAVCDRILDFNKLVFTEKTDAKAGFEQDRQYLKFLETDSVESDVYKRLPKKIDMQYDDSLVKGTNAWKCNRASISAQRDLLRLTQAKKFSHTQAFNLMAEVLCCEQIQSDKKAGGLTAAAMKNNISWLVKNDAFKNMFNMKKITPETVIRFLETGSAENLRRMKEQMTEKSRLKFEAIGKNVPSAPAAARPDPAEEEKKRLAIEKKNTEFIKATAQSARQRLAEIAASGEPVNEAEAKKLMVTVLYCEISYPAKPSAKEFTAETVNDKVYDFCRTPFVSNVVKNIDGRMIGDFLAEGGSTRLNDKLRTEVEKIQKERAKDPMFGNLLAGCKDAAIYVAAMKSDKSTLETKHIYADGSDKELARKEACRTINMVGGAFETGTITKDTAYRALAKLTLCKEIMDGGNNGSGMTREQLDNAADEYYASRGFQKALEKIPNVISFGHRFDMESKFGEEVRKLMEPAEKKKFDAFIKPAVIPAALGVKEKKDFADLENAAAITQTFKARIEEQKNRKFAKGSPAKIANEMSVSAKKELFELFRTNNIDIGKYRKLFAVIIVGDAIASSENLAAGLKKKDIETKIAAFEKNKAYKSVPMKSDPQDTIDILLSDSPAFVEQVKEKMKPAERREFYLTGNQDTLQNDYQPISIK